MDGWPVNFVSAGQFCFTTAMGGMDLYLDALTMNYNKRTYMDKGLDYVIDRWLFEK